ncbi:MAG TPA: response regulator [Phototrophicaceae bacterium]|jgi:CheY-like chemotaxis protein|nr:response regulator [Phototrophicaceae bacterium]
METPIQPLILIVDDDESARRLMQIMLDRAGYRTIMANTGEEALQLAGQHQPELIILDDVLPGIWGDEVREQLKQNPVTSAIKVMMFTGRVDKITEYKHRTDVAGVLPKPSHPRVVLSAIQACLS